MDAFGGGGGGGGEGVGGEFSFWDSFCARGEVFVEEVLGVEGSCGRGGSGLVLAWG